MRLFSIADDSGGFIVIFRELWKFAERVSIASSAFWTFMNTPIKLNLAIPGTAIPVVGQIVQALNLILGADWMPSFTLLQAFGVGLPILTLMAFYLIKTFVPLA